MPRPIRVLFGTETGNAEGCAEELCESLRGLGLAAELSDMDDYDHSELSSEELVLIVTSTFGNGDPPYNAHNLMEMVKGAEAPSLQGVRFSVCGLGDRSYPNFAQAGRDFDARFAALGAERVVGRMDCDVDFEVPFDQWKHQVLAYVREAYGATGGAPAAGPPKASGGGLWGKVSGWFGTKKPEAAAAPVTHQEPAPPAAPAGAPSREHPFSARVVASRLLSGPGSAKETRHYEIDLAGSGIAFAPGDSLGVFPANPPAEIDGIIGALGLDPEAPVTLRDGRTLALRGALARRACLQSVSVELLRQISAAGGPGADALAAGGEATSAYLGERYLLDVLLDHPRAALTAQQLVDRLKSLPPRLYSVASSPLVAADRVAFLVETLRYQRAGRPCEGVASVWLADRLGADAQLPLYLAPNESFHPPADDVDILMIGPGTGVAPFRAFLQERDARSATGKSWLFFGHQHEASDFLYRDELLAWRASGRLARLDLAWSRDNGSKVYVQDLLRRAGADAWSWLDRGAHVYVCGDAKGMAPGVHAALLQIAREHGGLDADGAEAWLRGLEAAGRYNRDVY